MHLEHSFSAPAGIERTWQLLLDVDRIASCIPGGTIESFDGDRVTGSIKVRLGTLGPTYKGTATVVEKDDDGRRAVVEAVADTRASGSARARIVITLSEFDGSTNVMVMSDVELTGKPGELEQKVISDAGDRLAKQFASRLATLLSDGGDAVATTDESTGPAPVASEEPAAADDVGPAAHPVAENDPPAAQPVAENNPPAARPVTETDPPAHHAATSDQLAVKRVVPVAIIVVLLLILRRRRRRARGRRS